MNRFVKPLLFAALGVLTVAALSLAQAKPDVTGWEKGGAYDKLYDVKEIDAFKGKVEDIIEVVPMPGMAKGVGIVVRDKKDNKLETVHLGPKEFVDLSVIGLRKGDSVKVTGVWATVGGKQVVMASKVKKDEKMQIKFRRTKDGMPWWSMAPEELAAERKAMQDDS